MSDFGYVRLPRPTLFDLVDGYERRLIEQALRDARGSQRKAAGILGILPTTLHEKMKRLGLIQAHPASEGLARGA
jgi:DNA-binding NtrC family response regulator